MTTSYSRHFLIAVFVLAVLAFTPFVTLAGGGGSGVRTNSTTGQFDSALTTNNNQGTVCTADAKMCPDGSFVGRVAPSCNFAACPTGNGTSTPPSDSNVRCPQDAKICPNGTSVRRVAPSCNFAACPTAVNAPAPLSDARSCPQDAKMCPDGTFVGRIAPSCNFAACPTSLPISDSDGTSGAVGESSTYVPPLSGSDSSGSGATNDSGQTVSNDGVFSGTSNSSSGICPQDAKMCPGGTFVGRTGPSCTFAACPTASATTTASTTGSDSGVFTNWWRPVFTLPGASNQNNIGTDSGVSNPFSGVTNTLSGVIGPVVSSVATAINPAFNMFSNAMGFGYDSVANNQNTSSPLFVNFGNLSQQTFDGQGISNRTNRRSTSTLQTLLDGIWNRRATTTAPTNIVPGVFDGSVLGGGGTKPNKTNTIVLEVKVTGANGSTVTNWSTSTAATVPQGGQLHFRWTASDYTQCLPFFNDNGRYALQTNNRNMTTGNTETEGYNVPEVTGVYRIECGGQKNDEMSVDQRSVNVTGAGTVASPLFGDGATGGPGIIGGTVSNTSGICAMDAKICPDGSSVGRTGPSCTFAACPTSNTDVSTINSYEKCVAAGYPVREMNPPQCVLPDGRTFSQTQAVGGVCPQDAKVCPNGSYVTRTGPSCSFAACPTTTNQSDSNGALFGN